MKDVRIPKPICYGNEWQLKPDCNVCDLELLCNDEMIKRDAKR